MTVRHLLMGGGLLAAAWLAFYGDKSPSSNIAESVTRDAAATKSTSVVERARQNTQPTSGKGMRVPDILVLQDRASLIGGTHRKPSGKGLFGSQNWTPLPPPPPAPVPPPPPPPPMAPPVPFSYIGKKFDGVKWEVYLMRGEQTYIVQESTVLDNTYHIDSIKPPILTLTYIPLQQVQTLTIGGVD